MAKQTTIIIGPEDVARVRLQCGKCETELVLQTRENMHMPDRCPTCLDHWRQVMPHPDRVGNLLTALRDLLNSESGPVSIRFEVDDSD